MARGEVVSLPRYPEYKHSGVEWLGEVPGHWAVVPLKYVVEMRSGGTPSKERVEYWNGTVPWASSKDLKVDELHDTVDHLTELAVQDGAATVVAAGASLVVVRGMILAHSFPVALTMKPMAINQDLKAVLPRESVDDRFLPWLLRGSARESLSRLDEAAHGTKALRMEAWTSMELPIPPVHEQVSISVFLKRETAKIDALMAEQNRLISLLDEKRQAAISHAVTNGLNPHAQMKESGVEWAGQVPAHWTVVRLARLFDEVNEPGIEGLPIFSVSIHSGVSDSELDEDELERKVTRSEDRAKYKRVVSGDLVYNMMRAWQGAFGTVSLKGMVSPAYVVARPRLDIETEFVELLLRTPSAVVQLRRFSHGVTDFRLRLYWEEFKNIVIAIPPVDEAKEIVAHVRKINSDFDALSGACLEGIRVLQERRKALIAAAVTGQVDVRGLASAEAA
jgi:type I restriction enzyme S subunit